jgi:hypothetical protein
MVLLAMVLFLNLENVVPTIAQVYKP